MGYEVERFAENVDDFMCPICRNVLQDPIQIKKCEHMFCRCCIVTWMNHSFTCPTDRMQIKLTHLRNPSRFFRIQYNRLKAKCQFVRSGCAEMLQIESIGDHESLCQYNDENHKNLIETLKDNGNVQSKQVESAMLAVNREYFCTDDPHSDMAQKIGYGSTISAPHMHATILELLQSRLTDNAKVLDIGSGSGYLTICMASMLGSGGKVIGIDHVSELIDQSKERVQQHFSDLDESRIKFITGDGREGYPVEGPYDVINIGGAMDEIPKCIIDQLKPNGRIIAPLLCARGQRLVTMDKLPNGKIKTKKHMKVRFGLIYSALSVQSFYSLFC